MHVHGLNAFGESKSQEVKRQNKTIKHKRKHREFWFIVRRKIIYLNNFMKTNLIRYYSKPYFILKVKEDGILNENLYIGTYKYSVLKY